MNLIIKHKNCYATHKKDEGKFFPFRMRLKPNAQFMTQRHSKVPMQYGGELNAFHNELEKRNIIKEIGSTPDDKPTYGTIYLNALII